MRIDVRQEHIDMGEQRSNEQQPHYAPWSVDCRRAQCNTGGRVILPADAGDFVRNFDRHGVVKPFSFEA